jgi:hypothetical protein
LGFVDVEPFAAESARAARALGAETSGGQDGSGFSPLGNLILGEVYGVVPRLRWTSFPAPAIGSKSKGKEASNGRKKTWLRPLTRHIALRHALAVNATCDSREPPGEYVAVVVMFASSARRPTAHGVAQ